jgi:predicted AlkP superfamily phosphohydrolase/phosphomutase
MSHGPVVVIGFDALCIGLVETWAAEGKLPTFQRLIEQSCWGSVDNPVGIEAGSVWPTFCIGLEPDRHGQYDGPYKFDTDAYHVRLMDRAERHALPFWVAASGAGRRVAIVDVPYVFLENTINGVQVVDWLTHVRVRPDGLATFPAELASLITATFGANPFQGPNRCPTNELALDNAEAVAAFRDRLLDRVRWKTDFALELIAQERWDLLVTVFHDAHDVGHMAWHVHDPGHERHDAGIAARVGDPMLDVYMALDAGLGRLLAALDGRATVLVYTSHGMGRDRSATRFLDDILSRIEVAYRGKPAPTWLDHAGAVYRAVVPSAVRKRLVQTKVVGQAYKANATEQLKGRRFFEVTPNHATGGVRFNLKGRERGGMLRPGRELDELCVRLEHDLAAITNADSGEPLIESIMRTSALYSGPHAHAFPDLLLEWNKRHPIRRVHSPLFGVLERRDQRSRSGDHLQKTGAFFAQGPAIRPGRLGGAVRPSDFAPTIAALLDLPTKGYSGTPIPGVVDPSHVLHVA